MTLVLPRWARTALLAVTLGGSGCAALSKGTPRQVQFFSLDRIPQAVSSPDATRAPPPASAPGIGLGQISGALYLEDKLVFRSTTFEVGYYADLRWTEPPERYLARRLARALFEEGGIRHVLGGAGPVLYVDLSALDEVRVGAGSVRAQLVASVRDGDATLWEQTITVDRPVAETSEQDHPRAVVDAMAQALEAAIATVVQRATLLAK